MTHQPPRLRRLLACAAAAATAALVAIGGAAAASATPTPPPSTITGTTANLHITKYLQPNTPGTAADGAQHIVTGTPLGGITFAAQLVPGIDLTTNAGWVAAAAETVSAAQSAVGAVDSGTTPEEVTDTTTGQANFTGLPIGLYLVTETSFPAGVTPSEPFLVTLPMTDPTNLNAWMYDVYVYPKNAETTATKTVQDATAVKLGDPMTFTITGDIPHVVNQFATSGNDGAIDKYEITDQLDPKVDYSSADVTITGMTSPNTAPPLVAGTDYTITPTTATPNGPLVTVTFTQAGRDVLANLWQTNLGAQVQVVLHTAVNAVGEIANTATLYPNSHSTGVTTPSVTTKWGGVTVLKQDNTTHAALSGATFQLYVTNSSTTQPNIASGSSDGPITISGADSWTTGTNGTVAVDGLRYSNWANGVAVADGAAGYHYYWLVETKAPAGYQLVPNPIGFTVTGPSAQVAGGPTASAQVVVNDVKAPTLPLTGGSGTAAFTVGGLVLLLLAGGGYLVAARRRRQAS